MFAPRWYILLVFALSSLALSCKDPAARRGPMPDEPATRSYASAGGEDSEVRSGSGDVSPEPDHPFTQCWGLEGQAEAVCEQTCTSYPSSKECLLALRFGPRGVQALEAARARQAQGQPMRPQEQARRAGMTAEQARYFDWFLSDMGMGGGRPESLQASSPEDLQELVVLSHRCAALEAKGAPARARWLACLRQQLELEARIFGQDSSVVMRSAARLADRLGEQWTEEGARLYQRALEIAQARYPEGHPERIHRLAEFASYAYDGYRLELADRLLREAVPGAERVFGVRHPYTSSLYVLWANLCLVTSRYDEARAYLERTLKIRVMLFGEPSLQVAQTYHSYGRLLLRLRDAPGTLRAHARAMAILEQLDQRDFFTVVVANDLATALARLGQYERAHEVFRRHLPLARQVTGARSMVVAQYLRNLGEVTFQLGRDEEAQRYAEVAHEMTSSIIEGRAHPDLARDLHNLSLLARRRGEFEEAFELQAEALEMRQQTLPELHPDRIYERLVPDPEAEGRLRAEPRYDAFVLTPGSCEVTRVDIGALEPAHAAVDAWRRAVEAAERCYGKRGEALRCLRPFARVDEAGRALREQLWAPVEPHLGEQEDVAVVLDGRLVEVPLGSLPDAEGRYLIEDYTLSYMSYPRRLLRAPLAPAKPARGALVLGDLDYTKASPAPQAVASWRRCDASGCAGALASDEEVEVVASVTPVRDGGVCGYEATWAPLRTEAPQVGRVLGRRWPGQVTLITGEGGGEPAVRDRLAGHRVLHLATHGFFSTDEACAAHACSESIVFNPMRLEEARFDPFKLSAVVLSGASAPGETIDAAGGILSAREVASMDLRGTELTVLSACETGRGVTTRGEGALGLAAAFGVAGSERTIVSLWRVPSGPTGQLFEDFYERRAKDPSNSSEATLRQVKRARIEGAREAGVPHSSYLWGSFVVGR